MKRKWIFRTVTLTVLSSGCLFGAAQAAPPWNGLITLKRVDADPAKQYKLTESLGPWMIMACSFTGDGAEKQAHDLVLELRSRYKLEAYTHKVKVDFGDLPARGVDQYGRPHKMKYNRGVKAIDEYAVLVGSYQTADDPAAQRILQVVKNAHPKCLEVKEGEETHQSMAGWRALQKKAQEAVGEEIAARDPKSPAFIRTNQGRGPMSHSCVTTNPLLPKDFFTARGVDEFVINMNKDVEYSLLDCPGKVTVQVAQFNGAVVIDQKAIKEVNQGKHIRSQLSDAGDKAETLTAALRMKGYKAYTFHDRYASIVTIGSFDSAGTNLPDGKIEMHPEILAIIEAFKAVPDKSTGKPNAMLPKVLVGIMFDIQPIPVQVPKRSFGADYSRSMLSAN